ncbi:MAG: VPLPA-CTERM sorting domain-containing protein [Sneathiella sp.]|nr:VPLPA-CTERM sorting domain-containing protein [Sneathiella sp.]
MNIFHKILTICKSKAARCEWVFLFLVAQKDGFAKKIEFLGIFQMKKILLLAGLIPMALYATVSSAATTVSSFDAAYTADYQWYDKSAVGGTASVENLTGQGGNLENNAPLGSGAAKLTTGPTENHDKGEVGINGNFGTVRDFLNGGILSYSYYKSSVNNGSPEAAASIKFDIEDPNAVNGGPATFVFEPYWNIVTGVSTPVPMDTWTDIVIDGTSGIFWHTGIYGEDHMHGDPGKTLADWVDFFSGEDFLSADIIGISMGVGTWNKGQTAYFDDVRFSSGDKALEYDFEVSVVPLPAALPLYGAGLAVLGFIGWRRKTRTASEA